MMEFNTRNTAIVVELMHSCCIMVHDNSSFGLVVMLSDSSQLIKVRLHACDLP